MGLTELGRNLSRRLTGGEQQAEELMTHRHVFVGACWMLVVAAGCSSGALLGYSVDRLNRLCAGTCLSACAWGRLIK